MSPPREVYCQRPAEHAFTYRYAQPGEYHFCLDSIIFAYFVSRQLPAAAPVAPDAEPFRALDLCAGCGVVGLELAYYRRWIEHFDFLEIQPLFRPYFEENLRITGHLAQGYRFLERDFRALATDDGFRERYDLIVANPPYFRHGEGQRPAATVRQRARFFTEASPADLIRGIDRALKPGGRAYFLMRPGDPHGRDESHEFARWLSPQSTWRVAADIRRTWAIEIVKSKPSRA